jgi:hypothetical protein
VFGALVALGLLHAALSGRPAPRVITAWCEWFAALVFAPYVFSFGAFGRWGSERSIGLVVAGWRVALVVFALDLLMRALLSLGWEPYFGL